MACSKIFCCGCCICTLVTLAAILAVSFFVVVPKVVQSQLNSGKFVLNNVTMLTCNDWTEKPYYAELINNASMENGGPSSVTVQPYSVTLSAYMCEDDTGSMMGGAQCNSNGRKTTLRQMGKFTAPENTLNPGNNIVFNKVRMDVMNATQTNGGFVVPLLLNPTSSQILVFEADSLDVSIMGFKVKGLKLSKRMACTYVNQPPDPEVTEPYCPKSAKSDTAIVIKCVETTEEYDNVTSPEDVEEEVEEDVAPIVAKSLVPSLRVGSSTCQGSGDPPSNTPYCYSGGVLGETVVVKVLSFASEKGTVDVTGKGIETFSCLNKPFTKAGQSLKLDVTDCVHKMTVTELDYCSDSDTILVKAQVGPIPASPVLSKIPCPSEDATALVV